MAFSHMAEFVEEQRKRGRKTDSRTFRRVLIAFRPYLFQIILILLAILVTTLLGLVNPLIIRLIFDVAFKRHDDGQLFIYVGILIVTPIISGVIGVGQTYLSNVVGQRVMYDFRNKLYIHLHRMPFRFFTSTRTGEIQSRLSNDINSAQTAITDTATSVVSNIVVVLSTAIAMLFLSPTLTLITLGLLPFILWITQKIGLVRRKNQRSIQQSMATLTAFLQETLSVSGVLLIKSFGRQQLAQKQFQTENKKMTDLSIHQQMIGRWFLMVINVILASTPAIVYLVAGLQLMHPQPNQPTISMGAIIAFTTLQTRLFSPLAQLLGIHIEIQGTLALFDRIFEYLDLPVSIQNKPDALHISPDQVKGEITFRNVSFSYKTDDLSTTEIPSRATKSHRPDLSSSSHDKKITLIHEKPTLSEKSFATPKKLYTEKSSDTTIQPLSTSKKSLTTEKLIPPQRASAKSSFYTTRPIPAHVKLVPLSLNSYKTQRQQTGAAPHQTLHDLSFHVEPGNLVALVGPSGAGKTTITYLIPRLFDVDEGSIEIDGHDVRDLTMESLSELIGIVTQETYLFHATIRENLLYGRPTASEETMIAATKATAIHERIVELENGYDTVVGERGYKLSGGEKQRIAIARVLLKDPRILILDEATSALDSVSERLIQDALVPLMQGRTTIAIAHRLSTILAADLILVIEKGRIIESGTHETLLQSSGLYKKLYQEQFAHKPNNNVG